MSLGFERTKKLIDHTVDIAIIQAVGRVAKEVTALSEIAGGIEKTALARIIATEISRRGKKISESFKDDDYSSEAYRSDLELITAEDMVEVEEFYMADNV